MPKKITSIPGEFVVDIARKAGGENRLLIPPSKGVHVASSGHEAVNRPKMWTHTFQCYRKSTYQELNDLVNSTPLPVVLVRYGIHEGTTSQLTDWESRVIVSVSARQRGTGDSQHGDLVTIVTSDLLYVAQKAERVASRKGRISAMAETMARDAGFEKFAIESTDLDYALVQSFESDLDFMTRRLVPMATSKEGASNYLMFAKGELFHFHTLGYQLGGLHALNYGDPNTTLDLQYENLGNVNELLPINGIKLVAYDPLAGVTTNWETKASREITLADFAPTRSGTVYRVGHVGQNQLANLYAKSQWSYATAKTGAYGFSFSADNYPMMSVGDAVDITVAQGRNDPWEGLYVVKEAKHNSEASRIKSRYVLVRGEFAGNGSKSSEGKRLNAAGIESSPLTTNTPGGFQLGSGQAVTVQNPT